VSTFVFRLRSFRFYVHFRFISPLPFSSFIYLLFLLLPLPLFFVSCYFIYVLFRRLLNYTGTSLPVPLHLGLVPRYYPPPNVFSATYNFIVSLRIPFLFFSFFHSTLLRSFFLPTLHVAILPYSSAGPRILPPPIVVLHFYLLSLLTDFYLFVMGSCFLIFQFVPVFYSTIQFQCLPAVHFFLTMKWRWTRLSFSFCFVWIYIVFINHIFHFLLLLSPILLT
jgi:hypothetical protein